MSKLYWVDGAALARLREENGWSRKHLASLSRSNTNLIKSLEDPEKYNRKGIREERKPLATSDTVYRLPRTLRVEGSEIAPDYRGAA